MKLLILLLIGFQCFAQNFEEKALSFIKNELKDYQYISMKIINQSYNKDRIEIDTSKKLILNKDIVLIPVLIYNKKSTTNSFISAKVKLFKNVLVAKRNIKKEEIVSSSDFEIRLLDVCQYNGNVVNINYDLPSYKTKAFIKKGEVLIEEKLNKVPIVNYGDKVCAEVKVGNVTITTDVIARQSGNLGDVINVVSLNNTILKAKIIDEDKVKIE